VKLDIRKLLSAVLLLVFLGSTAMFALMALAGDLGCSLGPSLIGTVSDAVGGDLKAGTLAGVIFPLGLVTVLLLRRRKGMSHNS